MILASCNNRVIENEARLNIKYKELSIDTVNVFIENTSYCGFSGICRDSLYFFDEFFNYCYLISTNGGVGSKRFGLGNARHEIPIKGPVEVSYTSDTNTMFVMGGTYDCYLLKDLQEKDFIRFESFGNKSDYDSPSAYTLWNEIIMYSDNDNVYYNIVGNNEFVDPVNRDDYYEKAALIMKANVNNGKMKPIGKYSQYYVENRKYLKHLPLTYFDINSNNGNFTVTHQADSLIYVYDSDFELLHSFGFNGIGMNRNYSDPNGSTEVFNNAYLRDKEECGYYYWIKNLNQYTFRTYQKDGEKSSDGLQIYYGFELIADVEVPKNFRVVGYIHPYFVTKLICDEDNENIKFYKFKLQ